MASHDLEDIIAVLDGASTAEAELAGTRCDLSRFLHTEFDRLASDQDIGEIVFCHLRPGPATHDRAERIAGILARLSTVWKSIAR